MTRKLDKLRFALELHPSLMQQGSPVSLDKPLPPPVLLFFIVGMGITSAMADAQNVVKLCNHAES